MIYIGIDVAKDKHDCLISNSDGEILFDHFTISNSLEGFGFLFSRIQASSDSASQIKIGLEATGHYSSNILEFLVNKNLPIFILNPLHTSLYRKSLSFRKTKTDKADVHSIVSLLMTQKLTPYIPASYHRRELKSLTRYRFNLVQDCSVLKVSFSRLMNLIFPELEKIVHQVQVNSVYQLMSEYTSASALSTANLTHLTTLLRKYSKGHYGREKAIEIRSAAKQSIGTSDGILSLELQQTLVRIRLLQEQISIVEARIKEIIEEIDSPFITIPGISYMTAAMIHAEVGDFSNFSSAEKILAFAGMEPSIYQSGQSTSTHARMVKRGSKYLRYALFTAAKNVGNWDDTFKEFLQKKLSEGKHYNVAVSHVAKKLVRTLYSMEMNHTAYIK
ncbi:IS110 family transposase [Anaerostipes caccae]|uniref:IS110 family transposase n=1 Tax=Anaerostipes caccae TaxID=105841 RepID=UPI0038D3BF14